MQIYTISLWTCIFISCQIYSKIIRRATIHVCLHNRARPPPRPSFPPKGVDKIILLSLQAEILPSHSHLLRFSGSPPLQEAGVCDSVQPIKADLLALVLLFDLAGWTAAPALVRISAFHLWHCSSGRERQGECPSSYSVDGGQGWLTVMNMC